MAEPSGPQSQKEIDDLFNQMVEGVVLDTSRPYDHLSLDELITERNRLERVLLDRGEFMRPTTPRGEKLQQDFKNAIEELKVRKNGYPQP